MARELKLDYAVLKRRVAATAAVAGDAPARTLAAPRFVELLMPADPVTAARASQAQCVVEMANARGAKMRVELSADALAGLPAMCSAFWAA